MEMDSDILWVIKEWFNASVFGESDPDRQRGIILWKISSHHVYG